MHRLHLDPPYITHLTRICCKKSPRSKRFHPVSQEISSPRSNFKLGQVRRRRVCKTLCMTTQHTPTPVFVVTLVEECGDVLRVGHRTLEDSKFGLYLYFCEVLSMGGDNYSLPEVEVEEEDEQGCVVRFQGETYLIQQVDIY